MHWRVIAIAYLLLQGIGGVAWWVAILRWPEARQHLVPQSIPSELFRLLLPADAVLFIGGSFLSAIAIGRKRRWAVLCLALHTGAAWYAGAIAWTMALRAESAWLSAILMLAPMIVLPIILWLLTREQS